MPCRDDGAAEYYAAQKEAELQKKLDKVTALLCATCEFLEQQPLKSDDPKAFKIIPGLGDWWRKHRAADAARAKREAEEAERERKAALQKAAKLESEARALRASARKK